MRLKKLIHYLGLKPWEKPLTSRELSEKVAQMKRGDKKEFHVRLDDPIFESYLKFIVFSSSLSDRLINIKYYWNYWKKKAYVLVKVNTV
jgi:hypothetical protein